MKRNKVVDDYITKIKKELYVIDTKSSKAVVEELENHIQEKSYDHAKEKGLEKPNDEIYQEVIEELGPPNEVVVDYLKVLPKEPGIGIKLFLGLQILIGIISVLIGLDQLRFSYDIYNIGFYDNSFLLSMILVGIILLFLGIITVIGAMIQFKKPQFILHYGTGSAMLSLGLATGILLIMSKPLIWRYTDIDYNDEMIYSVLAPFFLILIFAYILGFRSSEDFQRRFALEEMENKEFAQRRKKSRNVMLAIMMISIILISAIGIGMCYYAVEITKKEMLLNTEEIGGNYDARLEHWQAYYDGQWYDKYEIHYNIDGKDYMGIFFPEMRPGFNWVKKNTEQNDTVLCWWDYGHAIRGYTGRNAVIYSPSKSIKNTIVDPSTIKDWEDEDRVKRVAQALVATNSSETINVMKQYNSKYLITSHRDSSGITYAFFQAADLEISDYMEVSKGMSFREFTEKGRETLIYRVWAGEDIPGLELVYSDINSRIYTIS
ncbi:MAG: hypothetical protein JSW00_13075 [Thermoplasmata archaeon]|nr:MAG: hypothetical protein JSW00_13075 [Thermoplasmata archaeon]